MEVSAPTVGPIVGHTTPQSTRLWMRGALQPAPPGAPSAHRRVFGVARIRARGAGAWSDPVFAKLMPHFDVTGVCVLEGLTPDAEHEYEAGWFFDEGELTDLGPGTALDWGKAATGTFRTAAPPGTMRRRYAVGSCRYLLRLFGGSVFDERGDKTFGSILAQHRDAATRYDALVMLGDQIYADDLHVLHRDRTVDDYLERYRLVFGQPALRELMASVPSYMILDDHEIEDNWPRHATTRDRVTVYPNAIHAYQVYQASHSPLFPISAERRVDGTPERFWYTFVDGCCDWFVMDTRTERAYSGGPDRRTMISERQFDALCGWLADGSGQVKMIASAVPFFPDASGEGEDKWTGFRGQRARILAHVFSERIPRVVFLSGDVHCSFVAELTAPRHPGRKVVQVVSSSFYWPYPHTGVRAFRMNAKLAVPKGGAEYRVKGPPQVIATDNFACVEVDRAQLVVRYFARKGEAIGTPVAIAL